MFKRILTALLAALMALCALPPALAEDAAETARLSASGYMTAMDAMAAEAGVTLTWHSAPFSSAPRYTLHACETLQGMPVLICLEDTVVMLCTAVTYLSEQAPLEADTYQGQFLIMLTPLLTSQGMTDDEAVGALLPLVNEDGFLEAAARVSADSQEHHCFTILGYEAALLRLDSNNQTAQLCLYVYVAPDLMPRPQ
ncbi:MAG: hypothetical protein IKK57_03815 [Clostridia bacterium]|nr:hypothetical protein [Clostridia bacterium]